MNTGRPWSLNTKNSEISYTIVKNPQEKCGYRTGKCYNVRAFKRNGKLHKLCGYHREKANQNQMKLDRKKRFHREELISPKNFNKNNSIHQDNKPYQKKINRPAIDIPTRIEDAPPILAIDELDFFCHVMSPRQQPFLVQSKPTMHNITLEVIV